MDMELILVINGGSSTIKVSLFQGDKKKPIWELHRDWKGNFDSLLTEMLFHLSDKKILAIGHRIVHGGSRCTQTLKIDDQVKQEISKHSFLAPLHNPINLKGIEICEAYFSGVPQFAVFDTAFHHTLEPTAYVYPLPYSYLNEGIRRYGFHGISFAFCSKQAASFVNQDIKKLKMVICHLGAGASLCAIQGGKSIDTTMGMTTLEGLMMSTRAGSIDPGIIFFLLKQKATALEELEYQLNEKSGLLGISGYSSDMREIVEGAEKGNTRCHLALDLFKHSLVRCLGSMIASLGGIDLLVFTGGIGEHFSTIREDACNAFKFLGLEVDSQKNRSPSKEEREISSLNSRVKALVIPTQEEWEIASECRRMLYRRIS